MQMKDGEAKMCAPPTTYIRSFSCIQHHTKMLPSGILEAKTRDLLFVDDKDAVVLWGLAWDRMLTGHLPLIVTIEKWEKSGEKGKRC